MGTKLLGKKVLHSVQVENFFFSPYLNVFILFALSDYKKYSFILDNFSKSKSVFIKFSYNV